jgi:hypothetical protein
LDSGSLMPIRSPDSTSFMKAKTDLTDLEEGFIASAKSYGRRKGITQAAWRSLGVPADVLRKAGITRSE